MRFFFTATAGRSGQGYLTKLLNAHVPGCVALFEEPHVRPVLPGPLGDLERRFRRRFVETHELLGRGKAMTAFQAGDEAALDRMALKRIAWLEQRTRGAAICFDVSKYFVRGLHRATARAIPDLGLVRLARDPIANMRSFLNRNKDFRLDNDAPNAPRNALRLDPARLDTAGHYLWAWCEVYLRAEDLAAEFGRPLVEIRTEEMNDEAAMARHFAALGLAHTPLARYGVINTNTSKGFAETRVSRADIEAFERFRDALPQTALDRIAYFHDYDPRAVHRAAPGSRSAA